MRSSAPAAWPEKPLGHVLELVKGTSYKSVDLQGAGALIGLKAVSPGGGFRPDGLKPFSGKFRPEQELQPGDLIIALTDLTQDGSVLGSPAIVPDTAARPLVASLDVAKVNLKPGVDRDYAFFLLCDPHARADLAAYATGTTVRRLRPDDILAHRVRVPPLSEQRRIAWVLGSLDDKIELNRRIAETLEQIAAAIFKARFVDFVGVEEFEESELGPIPKGWRVGSLQEVASVTMGQSPPSSTYGGNPEEGIVMVQGKGAFGDRFPKREVFCSEPRRSANPGDILMTVRAPVGDINIAREQTCLGRGVAGLSSDHPAWLEQFLRSSLATWGEHESGTIYPSVNANQVKGLPLAVPPKAVLEDAELVLAPLTRKIAACHAETETLAAIRDVLLPKLISGKIRVPGDFGPDAVAEVADELVESAENQELAAETAASAG